MATVKVRGGPDKILNVLRGAGYDVRHLELDQHQRKHQLLPWWSRWSTPPTNYVGTFIFLSYFAVAVYLILLVVNHNIRPLLVTALQDQHRGLGSEVRRSLAFVLAGFAITSLNMINVLHQSYATHRAGTGSTTSLESIWSWMLETSLFRDFASDLMGGDDVAFWTRLSLAASAVMALHMRALGMSSFQPTRADEIPKLRLPSALTMSISI